MRNIAFISKLFSKLLYNRIFTMRIGLARGLKRRYGFGYKPKLLMTVEERFLKELDFSDQTVYDIGSYIGIYSLFFARAVGKNGAVISFEPNPSNYRELLFNISLNNFKNITPYNLGIGDTVSKMEFVIDPLFPTRGSFAQQQKAELLRKEPKSKIIIVDVASIDELIELENLPKPTFAKIDAEGAEMNVLIGMRKTLREYHPTLFIELHGQMCKEMCELLTDLNYCIYHIENKKKLNLSNYAVSDGHLFCQRFLV